MMLPEADQVKTSIWPGVSNTTWEGGGGRAKEEPPTLAPPDGDSGSCLMGGADDAAPPGSDELAEVTFSDSTANFKGQFHITQKISSSFF